MLDRVCRIGTKHCFAAVKLPVLIVPSLVDHIPIVIMMAARLMRPIRKSTNETKQREMKKDENFIDDLRKTTVMFCMLTTMHGFKTLCIGLQAQMHTKFV